MKKLLSILAATALVFGFASCSGDLHDAEIAPLYAVGDFCTFTKFDNSNNAVYETRRPFTKVSDTEQYLDFTYKTNTATVDTAGYSTWSAWGGGNGTLYFKICRDAEGWAQDWGWKKDIKKELEINADEPLELEARDATNTNPGNLVLKDLEEGQTYRLTIKYDAPTKNVKISVTGSVTDYPSLRVVKVADDGSENSYLMKRTGSTYQYEFTATEAGTFDYYITNGYLYWNGSGEMSTTKPADVEFASTITLTADVDYVIEADASKLLADNSLSLLCRYKEVTLTINVPGTGNYLASTIILKLTEVPNTIDGSLFSWDGGAAGEIGGSAPNFTVTATGLDNSSWISEQTPFKNSYPSGANASAKLKLNGGSDYWICFKNGGSYTFDWADRK